MIADITQAQLEYDDALAAKEAVTTDKMTGKEYAAAVRIAADAKTSLDNAKKRFSDFLDGQAKSAPANSSPQSQLFSSLLESWKKKSAGGTGEDLADVIAAANQANGRTRLASLCTRELPAYLAQAGKNSQSLRKARLSAQKEVQLATAESRALEARAELYAGFQASLAACTSINGTDDQKKACQGAVVAALTQSAEPAVQLQQASKQKKASKTVSATKPGPANTAEAAKKATEEQMPSEKRRYPSREGVDVMRASRRNRAATRMI